MLPPDLDGLGASETETEVPMSASEGTIPFQADVEPRTTVPEMTWDEAPSGSPLQTVRTEEDMVEAVFFEYGVVVFFAFEERHELNILEDLDNAGVMRRKFKEDDWEIEECHFAV